MNNTTSANKFAAIDALTVEEVRSAMADMINNLGTIAPENLDDARARIMYMMAILEANPRLTTVPAANGRLNVYWKGTWTKIQIVKRGGKYGALLAGTFTECGTLADAKAIVEINIAREEARRG